MRRREQDRLARMELDYQKRKEETEFLARREERLKAAEERTAKKRAKRQKQKEKKKQKRLESSKSVGEDEKTLSTVEPLSEDSDADGNAASKDA